MSHQLEDIEGLWLSPFATSASPLGSSLLVFSFQYCPQLLSYLKTKTLFPPRETVIELSAAFFKQFISPT